ncbi:MAG: hypothetical protein JSW40_09715 [Candidatus Omnitrophota bacterium]|nr:MAG: hypothetical protein JSW40_09715 [Candidatus Omnitrophota bacterium]
MKFHKSLDKPIGQILIEGGIITQEQLQKALDAQKKDGGLLGEVIVKLGFAREEEIAHCLSLQYSFPYLPLENYEISQEVIKLIPKNVCTHYCLIPLDRIENTLTVAMANPLNEQAIEDLEDISALEIQIFISTPTDIRQALERHYEKQ